MSSLLPDLPAWAQDQIEETPPAEGSPLATAVYLERVAEFLGRSLPLD